MSSLSTAGEAALPNIVLILADDTGYGDPPCYNSHSLVPMPNVDRLAAEGTRFTDAHSPSAICTPTRYGILTGRYYWRTPKKHALVMPYEPPVIEPERPTLPRILRGAGYTTACIGKWHLGFSYPTSSGEFTQNEDEIDFSRPLSGGPIDCGFDSFFGTAGCSTSDPPYAFIENRHTVGIPTVPSTADLHALPGFYPGLMTEDWVEEDVDARFVEEARAFIASADRPFFLYLPISAPHNPWLPPEHAKNRSREGSRGDMNVLVDWCVGEIYEALAQAGCLDKTLLVFTSDNGPMRGENGQRSAGHLRDYKNSAFEGGHRVPFVARWPKRIAPGATSDALICLTDLMASLAALTGQELPQEVPDSHNVLPSLLTAVTQHGAATHRALRSARPTIVSDTGGFASTSGDFAIRWDRWKLILLARDDDDALARRRRPVPDALDGKLLFDLGADPSEERNLAGERPDIVSWLESVLSEVKEKGSRRVDPIPPAELNLEVI